MYDLLYWNSYEKLNRLSLASVLLALGSTNVQFSKNELSAVPADFNRLANLIYCLHACLQARLPAKPENSGEQGKRSCSIQTGIPINLQRFEQSFLIKQ